MALTETLVRGERRRVPTREHLALAQLVRAEDVRVPSPAAPAEPPCSMSESLAHGLVNRLTSESREADLVACLSAGMPALPIKPAAAFRAGCRWLDATIPAGLMIGRGYTGDARGKKKDSRYGIIHWSPREDARSLVASLILLEVRKLRVTCTDFLEVTGHALMRLFYRLKTTDSAVVLAELSAAVLTFDHWAAVLDRFPVGCSVLVPTPTGVLAVAANRVPGSTSAGCVGRTWISHSRLQDNPARLDAAKRAFAERGIVVNVWPFPLLTPARIVAMRDQTQATGADLLNRVLQAQFPPGRRLPDEWHFR